MAFKRDSVVIIVNTALGGYSASSYRFQEAPCRNEGAIRTQCESDINGTVYRRESAHNTKVQLKQDITNYIDQIFNVLSPGEVLDDTLTDKLQGE